MNEKEALQTIELPEGFVSLANNHLPYSAQRPLEYLRDRGVSKKDIRLWKIGYCDSGRYGGRIIVPSFNISGDASYFVSRSYVGHRRKYLNPSIGKNFIFNELYIDWDEPVIIVEGIFDAIVAGTNAIPILGSTLRPESKLFQALAVNDTPVYIALDKDAEKKTGHMIKNMLQYNMEVYKIDTTTVEDVGSMQRDQFKLAVNRAELVDYDCFFFEKILRSSYV
jgi:DNA primase